jgi:hypothetical protein
MTAPWAKRTIWAGAVKSTGPRENKKEKKELESWLEREMGQIDLGWLGRLQILLKYFCS